MRTSSFLTVILIGSNVMLAVGATTCLKLRGKFSLQDDAVLLPLAFFLNAAAFSLLPFILNHVDLGVSHSTIACSVSVLGFASGTFIFEERVRLNHVVGIACLIIGLMCLNFKS